MSTFSGRDLISAERWSKLLFTTYALNLSFFEAVVLEAMVREQSNEALILADKSGVLGAMHEVGAQGVGRIYDVEPISVDGGCFHSKMTVASTPDDAHILIGSGNLTFGGWGANLECIEHLHVSFAPEAILDAAQFLERLATSPRVHHGAADALTAQSEHLSAIAARNGGTGPLRLLHNLDHSIIDQLAILSDGLGKALSLCVASPFFDSEAVASLCDSLGLSHAFVHVHPHGSVLERGGTNWPGGRSEKVAHPVTFEWLVGEGTRLLHAKLYEIRCKRGRILVSGSSNATLAGLHARRNVELNVVRIEREALLGWRHQPAETPVRFKIEDDSADEKETRLLMLRAALIGTRLAGEILEPAPSGTAALAVKVGLLWQPIGEAFVSSDGTFSIGFVDAWHIRRQIQLRVAFDCGAIAQGFVRLPEEREITRRLGPAARNFLSVLEKRETAADIRAILEFIHDRPEWLTSGAPSSASNGDRKNFRNEPLVNVQAFLSPPSTQPIGHSSASGHLSGADRFMAQVFAALREPRGPIERASAAAISEDEERGDYSSDEMSPDESAAEIDKTMKSFEMLLDLLLRDSADTNRVVKAAAITQYVCDRLEMDSQTTFGYLDRVAHAFHARIENAEDLAFSEALLLLWASRLRMKDIDVVRRLRRILLRIGSAVAKQLPPLNETQGLLNRLNVSTERAEHVWSATCSTRIIQEEIVAYWADQTEPRDAARYPLLSRLDIWSEISPGPNARVVQMRIYKDYCPHCYLALSTLNADQLLSRGAVRCRGVILLCGEF